MAWGRPINLFHYEGERDAIALATALLFGIVRLHPFAQGNKRTGFVAAVMFLELNGYVLTIPDGVFVAELILGVIEGRGTEQEFAELLRDWIVPTPGADAR